jgi:hypothetical protein
MSRYRRTISMGVFAALALTCAAPASAYASPLLSGYGGPGQGSQAIIGSELLNGPPGGGGGSAGPGAGSTSAASSSTAPGAGASVGGVTGAHRAAGQSRSPGTSTPMLRGPAGNRTSVKAGSAYHYGLRSTTYGMGGGASTLGVSGADLLYLVLGVTVLLLTGVLTSQLTRRAR